MGGKSGGGSSSSGSESPDTLRSIEYARVLDLVAEGEIEGWADPDHPLRCIYLDDTPIENEDGTENFTGVTTTARWGTQGQSYVRGFPSAESEESVSVQVKKSVPVVRSIANGDFDAVRVTIGVPSLVKTNTKTGDVTGTKVQYAIDLKSAGGDFVEVVNDTISGKTTTRYQRSKVIPLTGSSPWTIRIRRLTDDSDSQYLANDIYWDSYTKIVNAKLTYLNRAIVGQIIDASQFSSIPTRGYDLKLKRIRIPTNATVDADTGRLTYSGIWDGTFKIAWTSNPAWVFFDLITDDRYGLGDYIDSSLVDKWALYEIGKYCDELVDDGYGGQEPRFSAHIYIQSPDDAINVLSDFASVFRGICYWGGGQIVAVQDSPRDPVALFTAANTIDENGVMFSYAGSSLKTRHSAILVQFNDPDNLYQTGYEYVQDQNLIEKLGIVSTTVTAYGCASRGQAARWGKWLLYTEAYETEVVTFSTGLDGALLRCGDIIQVSDPRRAGARRGGRIAGAGTSTLTLDKVFTLSQGQTYTFSAMLPDGTVESAIIDTVDGNVVTLKTPLSKSPQKGAIWVVSSPDLETSLWRVTKIDVQSGSQFSIAAVAHYPDKYAHIESGLLFEPPTTTALLNAPNAPTGLSITESLYTSTGTVRVLVTVSWNAADRATSYQVTYHRDDGPDSTVTVYSPTLEIRDALSGVYAVSVVAKNILGRASPAARLTQTVYGKLVPPANVKNFTISGIANGVAQLTWAQAADLDVQNGGYVRIRHTPNAVSPDWSNAIDISSALAGSVTTASVPHLAGVYLAKFIDSSGKQSMDAAVAVSSVASLIQTNIIETITEHICWSGTHANTIHDASAGGLQIDNLTVLVAPPLDQWEYTSLAEVITSGTYDFAAQDLGAVYTSQLTAAIESVGLNLEDYWDSDELLDSETDYVDGTLVDDVNAALLIRYTSDDPASGSAVWSDWEPFFTGQYVARGFQFKLCLTSGSVTHNILVKSLTVTIDMPDRVEAGNTVTSAVGSTDISFAKAFHDVPAVGITPSNLGQGEYYAVTSKTRAGFTVTFYDSAGNPVSRIFDWIAKGYGTS